MHIVALPVNFRNKQMKIQDGSFLDLRIQKLPCKYSNCSISGWLETAFAFIPALVSVPWLHYCDSSMVWIHASLCIKLQMNRKSRHMQCWPFLGLLGASKYLTGRSFSSEGHVITIFPPVSVIRRRNGSRLNIQGCWYQQDRPISCTQVLSFIYGSVSAT